MYQNNKYYHHQNDYIYNFYLSLCNIKRMYVVIYSESCFSWMGYTSSFSASLSRSNINNCNFSCLTRSNINNCFTTRGKFLPVNTTTSLPSRQWRKIRPSTVAFFHDHRSRTSSSCKIYVHSIRVGVVRERREWHSRWWNGPGQDSSVHCFVGPSRGMGCSWSVSRRCSVINVTELAFGVQTLHSQCKRTIAKDIFSKFLFVGFY